MGAAAVEALVALSSGEEIQSQIDVPVTIVTTENVGDYRETFK